MIREIFSDLQSTVLMQSWSAKLKRMDSPKEEVKCKLMYSKY